MAHFSVVSLTQVILLLVFICWTTSSTGAAFSLEEELLQLKENYIQMTQVVKSLEVKVEQQDSLLTSLLREKNERTVAVATDFVPNSNNQSGVAINGLPSSCEDLKMIGHIWNGFYSVMGSAMMESVYCDFTKLPGDTGFQKWIGYVDVKSAPVHFYVQRESDFDTKYIPIPFDVAVVNNRNAMDLTSGIFTAPQPGIYFFSFTGLAYLSSSSTSWFFTYLYLNGNRIGSSSVHETFGPVDQFSAVTLQSTLNLKKGDQLWMQIDYSGGAVLSDHIGSTGDHRTHFTGFMLEEEIVASL